MLEKQPPEVILTISSHLNFKNKLNLIATCRRLYSLISKTCLFSELDLLEQGSRAEHVIQLFKKNHVSGAQVKLLWIDMERLPDQVLFELSTIFPNITRLITRKLHSIFGTDHLIRDQYAKGPMLKWCNTLETFNLSHDWPYILHTMKTTLFPRLTELEIGFYYDFKDKKEGFDFPYFIPYIKNAPSLKKLILERYAIDLSFLEEIHSSCPYMETLILDHTQIVIKDRALPQQMTAVDSLLHLEIKHTNIFDKNGLFLDYIISKYRRLKSLQLGFSSYYDTSEFGIYYQKVDLFDSFNSDEESDGENDGGIPITDDRRDEYMEIYESLEYDLEVTFQVYRLSGSKFFAHLPKTIKTLIIPFDLFNNLMEVLAKSDIKPTQLTCMRGIEGGVLGDPEQFQYIKDITSLKSLEIGVNLTQPAYDQIFPSHSVTKLSIVGQGDPFYIDWLLAMFPSLEELCILGGQNIAVRKDTETNVCYPNLLLLVVRNGTIDQSFIDFFKVAAPNINTLSLTATVSSLSNKKDINIDISQWKLRLLNIALFSGFTQQCHFYHIKSKSLSKTLRFNPRDQTITLLENNHKIDPTDKPGDVNITGVTHQYFMFHGFALYLMHDKLVITY